MGSCCGLENLGFELRCLDTKQTRYFPGILARERMPFPLKRKCESSPKPAGAVASSSNNLERGKHTMRGRSTGRSRDRGRSRGRSFHIPRNASQTALLTEVWKHRTHSPCHLSSQSRPVPPSSPPSHPPPSPAPQPQPQPDENTKTPQLLHGSTKATCYHNLLASMAVPSDTSNVAHDQPDPRTKQNVCTKPPHRRQKGIPSALVSVPVIHISSTHLPLDLQPPKVPGRGLRMRLGNREAVNQNRGIPNDSRGAKDRYHPA